MYLLLPRKFLHIKYIVYFLVNKTHKHISWQIRLYIKNPHTNVFPCVNICCVENVLILIKISFLYEISS